MRNNLKQIRSVSEILIKFSEESKQFYLQRKDEIKKIELELELNRKIFKDKNFNYKNKGIKLN